ncbi:MAG: hypothetical protein JXR96_28610 [Deltaproteobacteria bacterium]|nr:hypothetical protein [Deltaproteobacteria bacterium]
MRLARTCLAVVALCIAWLATDLDIARPMVSGDVSPSWARAEPAGQLVARRRRKPRPRRKPKPKPKPAPAPEAEPAPEPEADSGGGAALPVGPGGRARVDFEAQLIKGQTTKAGEVQILARKDSELKSMVMRRTSFRDEIIQTVFPEKIEP